VHGQPRGAGATLDLSDLVNAAPGSLSRGCPSAMQCMRHARKGGGVGRSGSTECRGCTTWRHPRRVGARVPCGIRPPPGPMHGGGGVRSQPTPLAPCQPVDGPLAQCSAALAASGIVAWGARRVVRPGDGKTRGNRRRRPVRDQQRGAARRRHGGTSARTVAGQGQPRGRGQSRPCARNGGALGGRARPAATRLRGGSKGRPHHRT